MEENKAKWHLKDVCIQSWATVQLASYQQMNELKFIPEINRLYSARRVLQWFKDWRAASWTQGHAEQYGLAELLTQTGKTSLFRKFYVKKTQKKFNRILIQVLIVTV